MPLRLTGADFIFYLVCHLANLGVRSLRWQDFERIATKIYDMLKEREFVNLRFRITPHPVHGDSAVLRSEILAAHQRGILSSELPGENVYICLARETAVIILLDSVARQGDMQALFLFLSQNLQQVLREMPSIHTVAER